MICGAIVVGAVLAIMFWPSHTPPESVRSFLLRHYHHGEDD